MMAGATLRLDLVGLDDAGRRLSELAAAGQDLTPVFRNIGEYLVRTTKDRFRNQEDPTGKPWASLSEDYKARKKRNRDKILTLDAFLRGSITYHAAPAHLDVGSPMIYAGTHQFGAPKGSFGTTSKGRPIPWGDIPARPFLGLSDADVDQIGRLVTDYLAESVS